MYTSCYREKRFLTLTLKLISVLLIFIFMKEMWDIFAVYATIKCKFQCFTKAHDCLKKTGWTVPVTDYAVD